MCINFWRAWWDIFFLLSLDSTYLLSKMESIENVSHSSINSQGVKVDTLPATRLKTQSGKSKLFFPLRKFSMRGKQKAIFLKHKFEDSFFQICKKGLRFHT